MNEPTQPRKKSLLRRFLKYALYTFLGLLILVGLAIALLHTSPGQDFITGVVEDKLGQKVNGKVTIDAVEFALFGDIALRGLTIQDESGADAIGLDDLEVALDWGSLFDDEIVIDVFRIAGVQVQLLELEPGKTNLTNLFKPNEDKLEFALAIKDLDISGIDVTVDKLDGTHIALTDLALKGALSVALPTANLDVDLQKIALGLDAKLPDGKHITLAKLETALRVKAGGGDLDAALSAFDANVTVQLPDADKPIHTKLSLAVAKANIANGHVAAELSGLTVAAFSMKSFQVEGALPKDGVIKGEQRMVLDGLAIHAKALNSLLGRDLLATDVTVDVSLMGPPNALALTGNVGTDGGDLALTGLWDITKLERPAYSLHLEGKEIRTEDLVAMAIPKIHSSLALDIVGAGATKEDIEADLTLVVGPTEINVIPIEGLTLVARIDRGHLTIKKFLLELFEHELNVDGVADSIEQSAALNIRTSLDIAGALERVRAAGLPVPENLPFSFGTLDIDLAVSAKAKDPNAPPPETADSIIPAELAAKLPVSQAAIKGTLALNQLVAGKLSIGSLTTALDLSLEGTIPKGTIGFSIANLENGDLKFKTVDGSLALDGDTLTVDIIGDDGQGPAVELNANARLDKERQEIVIDLQRLKLRRGSASTELVDPVTLRLPASKIIGPTDLSIPQITLALAGGTVGVGGQFKIAPKANGEEGYDLQYMDASINLSGVRLEKAAALAGKSIPVSGSISGRVDLLGTPQDPKVGVNLDIKAKLRDRKSGVSAADSIDLRVTGNVERKRLQLDTRLANANDPSHPFLTLDVSAPLTTGETPGLASSGTLQVSADLPRTRLRALTSIIPSSMIPEKVDLDSAVELHADLSGSPSRPEGTFSLDVAGPLAGAFVESFGSTEQHVALSGKLSAENHKTRLEADLEVWHDSKAGRTLKADVGVLFARSPLLTKKPQISSWTAVLDVGPLILGDLPLPAGAPKVGGTLELNADLRGDLSDVLGTIDLSAQKISLPDKPLADLGAHLNLQDEALGANVDLALGGRDVGAVSLDMVRLAGELGLGGKGLLSRVKKKEQFRADLDRAKLAFTLELPRHTLKELASLAPGLDKFPGSLGGQFQVGGVVKEPTLLGGLTYEGFTALDGDPGQVAVLIDAGLETIGLDVALGAHSSSDVAPVGISVDLNRRSLLTALTGTGEGFDVTLSTHASKVPLKRLVPNFALDTGVLEADGNLNLDLGGTLAMLMVESELDGSRKPKLADARFSGGIGLQDGVIGLPGTGRSFHDVQFVLKALPTAIALERLEVHETDLQQSDRFIKASGEVELDGLEPGKAALSLELDEWLAIGPAKAPDGVVSAKAAVDADLTQPIKLVNVTFDSLTFEKPDRYERGHAILAIGETDIVWLDEVNVRVGQLPTSEPVVATAAPAEAAPAAPSTGGAEIHLLFPNRIHLIAGPFNMWAIGQVDIDVKEKLKVNGELVMQEGTMQFLGNYFELDHGSVLFNEKYPAGGFEFYLKHAPGQEALRDLSLAQGDESVLYFHGPITANELDLSGFSGPNIVDVMALDNSGTTRWTSGPALPAAETVQHLNTDRPLVQTFVMTNLPHLMFLDRAKVWADPYVTPDSYSHTENFEGEVYSDDGTTRVRTVARPRQAGRSRAELQFDWLFGGNDRNIVGFGPRLGSRGAAGLELFWEWASEQ